MTPEEQAHLKAICDEPFNDLPRLVYADWLEETGEAEKVKQAKMIRQMIDDPSDEVQLGLSKTDGQWKRLYGPDGYIVRQLRNAIRSGEFDAHGPRAILSRGFIGELHCTQAEFMGTLCGRCAEKARMELSLATFISQTIDGTPPTLTLGDKCPACNGTGRIPGFVEQFDRLPITKVVLTDQAIVWADVDLAEIGRHQAGLKRLRPTRNIREDLRAAIYDEVPAVLTPELHERLRR